MRIGGIEIGAMFVGGQPVVAAYLGGAQVFGGASVPRAAVIVLLGQSLNAPRGSIVTASPVTAGPKMLTGGAAITSWQFHATNVDHPGHWSETASVVDFEERTGQTPMVGLLNEFAGSGYDQVYIGGSAIGARQLNILVQRGPLANTAAIIQRTCQIARDAGYSPEVIFYSAHGEANAAAGTTEQSYYDQAIDYYTKCQLLARQAMRNPAYTAPVLLTYPGANISTQSYLAIKAAIRRVAIDLPGGVDAGPIYQWPMETYRTHPTGPGYILRGEWIGRLMRLGTPQALHINSVTLSGTTFVVTFNQPVVRDASLNVGSALAGTDGFEWLDDVVARAISGLVYSGATVTGTLATTPTGTLAQQTLRLAAQAHPTTTATWPTNVAGSFVRAAGSGFASISDPTYTHHVWASPRVFTNVEAA